MWRKLWEKRKSLDQVRSINSYLFGITKNLVINKIKENLVCNIGKAYIRNSQETEVDLNNEIAYKEFYNRVEKCLDELPERRREIFLLSRLEGLSYKQISAKLNITENTVDSQIRNALNFLRKKLDYNSL